MARRNNKKKQRKETTKRRKMVKKGDKITVMKEWKIEERSQKREKDKKIVKLREPKR